jgi:cell wall-associated NlpC family hydrolase
MKPVPALTRRHPCLLWLLAAAAVLAGCTSTPLPPSSVPTPPSAVGPNTAAPTTHTAQRNDVVLYAMGLLDTPYRWGGRGPATGFDCSGLVSHVFREAIGLRVQGTSAELGRKARPIPAGQLLPGDLVFFNTLGARHSHVGVYVGDGRFVHASNPRTGVRIDPLSNRYYAQRFEGAGRLLD